MTNAISYSNECALCAADLVAAKKHDDASATLRENVNKRIVKLNKDKVVIGRYSKEGNGCANAMSFVDTLIVAGWAKKTAQNYLSLFKEAVKTGKPVADWGGTKAGGRKTVNGKAPKQERANPALDALFKFIKTEGGLDTLQAMQSAFDDAEGDLSDIAIEMLKAEGYEIE
jgi:ribosomal protein S7